MTDIGASPWAVQGELLTWAPSVMPIDGVYRMYVTVGDRARRTQCIAVASSLGPAGPFTLEARGSLVCGRTGAIDANPFRAAAGTLWLDW
ncbi:MAG: family 43 glycosylhydrolase, partial [Candidatus Eremiobacteraeota bacterium]|nr:family 43 glycosylhydrolase [Candidatus Eremiobacteraeota bacterium]